VFVKLCLQHILNVRWPKEISNEELWQTTQGKPTEQQIKERKWRWIGHKLGKPQDVIERPPGYKGLG
jgi:hypothetical protein